MDPLSLSAAIGAAGAIGGGVLNTAGSLYATNKGVKLADKQMQWNEQMLDKQNAFSHQMWNENNVYNSPTAQVDRLRSAGLNPLFYGLDGNGNGSQLQSAGALGYSNPHVDNPLAGVGAGVSQAAITAAQLENLKADTNKKESETELTTVEAEIRSLTKDNVVALSGLSVELSRGDVEKQQTEIARIKMETDKLSQDMANNIRALNQKDAEIALKRAAVEVQKYVADNNLSIAQKQIAVAWYNAMVNKSGVEANNAYLSLQGDKIAISNEREAAELEAKKPLMKFDAYVDSANGVIDGICGAIGGALSIGKLIRIGKNNQRIITSRE